MSLLDGFKQAISIDLKGTSNLSHTMGDATAQLDSFAASAKKLGLLGGMLAGVGVAITGFTAMTVKSTTGTQAALGEMASLGFTAMGSLEQAASDFSSEFAGTTKADFIKAAYDIKSGIASLSDDAVGQFTRLAALTAKATKSTVVEMTSLFASAYGIYKDFYEDLSDFEFGKMFSGGIAAAVQAFKTTGPEMAAAISQLGASATSALVPMEEQLSILGMLQASMSGSEAGTKYKAFMNSAARAGEQLGISFVDARGKLLPMTGILDKISQQYGEIDALEKIELTKAFQTKEAVAVIDLLLPKIETLTGNIDSMSTAMGSGTVLTLKMAQAMNMDLGAVLNLLKQRMSNTFEALGKTILPIVIPVMNAVSSAADAFRNWAEQHPGLVRIGMDILLIGGAAIALAGTLLLAGAGFGAMAAGITGAAVAMGIGTAGTMTFTGALAGLGAAIWTALSPILPIIGAVVAVVGLFALAWKTNFMGIRDIVLKRDCRTWKP